MNVSKNVLDESIYNNQDSRPQLAPLVSGPMQISSEFTCCNNHD